MRDLVCASAAKQVHQEVKSTIERRVVPEPLVKLGRGQVPTQPKTTPLNHSARSQSRWPVTTPSFSQATAGMSFCNILGRLATDKRFTFRDNFADCWSHNKNIPTYENFVENTSLRLIYRATLAKLSQVLHLDTISCGSLKIFQNSLFLHCRFSR